MNGTSKEMNFQSFRLFVRHNMANQDILLELILILIEIEFSLGRKHHNLHGWNAVLYFSENCADLNPFTPKSTVQLRSPNLFEDTLYRRGNENW